MYVRIVLGNNFKIQSSFIRFPVETLHCNVLGDNMAAVTSVVLL